MLENSPPMPPNCRRVANRKPSETSSSPLAQERSGERPKYRLNSDTALRYDCYVAGDRLRTVMFSIMRRRKGLITATAPELPVSGFVQSQRISHSADWH